MHQQADQALQTSMMYAINEASAGDVIVLISSDGGFQVRQNISNLYSEVDYFNSADIQQCTACVFLRVQEHLSKGAHEVLVTCVLVLTRVSRPANRGSSFPWVSI